MTGIDVSHYQSAVNWPAVAASDNPKVDFAIIKATQGVGYVDPMLKFHSFEAKNAGIKIGYYHFATLNSHEVTKDAESEAIFFVDTVKKMPAPDLPLVLDIEIDKADLSKFECQAWIKSFFDTLQQQGRTDYVLYSSTGFLNDNLPAGHGFSNVRLWLAQYTTKPAPKLPIGWSDYWLWQYTQTGRVPGIKGYVDINRSKQPLVCS